MGSTFCDGVAGHIKRNSQHLQNKKLCISVGHTQHMKYPIGRHPGSRHMEKHMWICMNRATKAAALRCKFKGKNLASSIHARSGPKLKNRNDKITKKDFWLEYNSQSDQKNNSSYKTSKSNVNDGFPRWELKGQWYKLREKWSEMAPFSDHTWSKPCAWLTFVHQPNFWQGALMGKHNFIKTQNHNSDSIATSCAGGSFWWMESHITLIPFTWILMSPTKLKALNQALQSHSMKEWAIVYQFNPFFNISPNLVALPNKPLEKILKCIQCLFG